jgi:hypothetical protein
MLSDFMLKKIFKTFSFLLIAVLFFLDSLFAANRGDLGAKPVELKWEEVDGAIKYKVVIKDIHGKTIIDKYVEDSSAEVKLSSGTYRIRIGVVNKFNKLSTWSDWENFQVLKKQPRDTRYGIRLSSGVMYSVILSDLNKIYDNGFPGIILRSGIYFGEMDIDWSWYVGFLNYIALEVDGSYVNYQGASQGGTVTELTCLQLGGNFVIKSAFEVPYNFIIRAGYGVARSVQEYKVLNTTTLFYDTKSVTTTDPYYKGSVGVDYKLSEKYFAEFNVEFNYVKYLAPPDLAALQFNLLIGIQF